MAAASAGRLTLLQLPGWIADRSPDVLEDHSRPAT